MKVIGVSGPSGAGKTTISNKLAKVLPDCKILRLDWYFIDPKYCEEDANFCDHSYLHIDEFTDHFDSLLKNETVSVPVINYSTFKREKFRKIISPGKFLIVEGMTIFRIKTIIDKCDLRFYLAPDMETVRFRKRNRDVAQRNKTLEVIETQLNWIEDEYLYDLKNMDDRITILRGEKELEEIVQTILSLFKS